MLAIRPALPVDLAPLAALWEAGWHEAHDGHVPEALARLRTTTSFRKRIAALKDDLRTAGPKGDPRGFCAIRDDEIYQLYVSPKARSTGLARRLLADGETRLAESGVTRAFLLCAPGNLRGVRFYERAGWESMGTSLETVDGVTFDLVRFEKTLTS